MGEGTSQSGPQEKKNTLMKIFCIIFFIKESPVTYLSVSMMEVAAVTPQ